MIRKTMMLAAAMVCSSAAFAAPKLQNVAVKPNPAQSEVAVTVSVSRTKFDKGGCDARVDFGDGTGRTIDFGVAATRSVHHAYKKSGNYIIVARGAGATPCDGSQQSAVKVAGEPRKKPSARQPTKKKEETQ